MADEIDRGVELKRLLSTFLKLYHAGSEGSRTRNEDLLFGIPLLPMNPAVPSCRVHVVGIREGTPNVALGDTVLLRQLVIDPITGLPKDMDAWIADNGVVRGIRAPGFTGYEIQAVVLQIGKKFETWVVRASEFLPELPICNVSFVFPSRLTKSLQRAITSVAQELSEHLSSISTSFAKRAWLPRMLFPMGADGTLQSELPPAGFELEWFDQSLNYEQRLRNNRIPSNKYLTSQ